MQRITAGRIVDVYDLTVEGEHEFFANGVLVHNCIAALVYLWRNVVRTLNPFPPEHVGKSATEHYFSAEHRAPQMTPAAKALARAFAGNRYKPRGRVVGR